MLYSLRQRSNDEGGFTLIELLVVILIIGILAAIAIPAFLSQTSKANDAAAKTQVGTMQTTMETYATENSGSYTGATLAELQEIEPTLKDTTTATAQTPVIETVWKAASTVHSVAQGTGTRTRWKTTGGVIKRTCTAPAKAVCNVNGTW